MKPLPLVKAHHALHLRALVDIEADETGTRRKVGDEWQLNGPITYLPRPEVVGDNVSWEHCLELLVVGVVSPQMEVEDLGSVPAGASTSMQPSLGLCVCTDP